MGESIIFDFGSIAERLPKEPKIIKPTQGRPTQGIGVIQDPFHPMVLLDLSALRMITIRDAGGQRLVNPYDFGAHLGIRELIFNGATFEVR